MAKSMCIAVHLFFSQKSTSKRAPFRKKNKSPERFEPMTYRFHGKDVNHCAIRTVFEKVELLNIYANAYAYIVKRFLRHVLRSTPSPCVNLFRPKHGIILSLKFSWITAGKAIGFFRICQWLPWHGSIWKVTKQFNVSKKWPIQAVQDFSEMSTYVFRVSEKNVILKAICFIIILILV